MLVVTVRSMIPMTYREGMGSTSVGRECGQGQGAGADTGRARSAGAGMGRGGWDRAEGGLRR